MAILNKGYLTEPVIHKEIPVPFTDVWGKAESLMKIVIVDYLDDSRNYEEFGRH